MNQQTDHITRVQAYRAPEPFEPFLSIAELIRQDLNDVFPFDEPLEMQENDTSPATNLLLPLAYCNFKMPFVLADSIPE